MGTRHLTIVQKNGEYKVAQYGQWDGYPEYSGKLILEFCREHLRTKEGRDAFSEKIVECKFISDEMVADLIDSAKEINDGYDENFKPYWARVYPQFSRDTGCDILNLILNSNNGMLLQNTIEFIKDSLFCEWAWVIDLDKNTFEAFRGFNRRHLGKSQRFYKFDNEKDAQWKPCRFVAGWNLDNLPTEEHFMEAFKERDIECRAEELDWSVEWYEDVEEDTYVEFSKYSPAGEDFSFDVYYTNVSEIPEKVIEYYEEFDAEEHVMIWAEHAGRNGVPRLRGLIKDADAIKDMIRELANALKGE